MSKWFRDTVLIPVIIALVIGFVLMLWGAWYSGVKWHSPLSASWLETVFTVPIPLWLFLAVAIVGAIMAFALRREISYGRLLGNKIEELEKSKPRLHGVWDNTQTFWSMGRKGNDPAMQVGGWIHLSSKNTDEIVHLLAAYIDGVRSDIFVPLHVKPNLVEKKMVSLFMVPPLETDDTKPFTATIVLEDQWNRMYELPRHTFRATPIPKPPPPQN